MGEVLLAIGGAAPTEAAGQPAFAKSS
jgi:hypothetical protein